MEKKVISLNGGPTGEREICSGAVAALTDALEKAKSGELIGVVIVERYFDSAAGYQIGGKMGGYTMLGAFELARAEMIDVNRAEDE